MNAGTHLGEAKDRLVSVNAYDFQTGEYQWYTIQGDSENSFENTMLKFEYRKNLFLNPSQVVIETEWKIQKQDPVAVKAALDVLLERRKNSQPVEFPSCGSVFKNPSDMKAWEVVDELGLRGRRMGRAQISEKHSNFIVNLGGASAADVRGLIELVKVRARDELGITMEEEVKYLG